LLGQAASLVPQGIEGRGRRSGEVVESEALGAAASDGHSKPVERISVCFASVAFLDPVVLGRDVEVVAVASSRECGVGVLAGGGVVGEDEAAVDGGALGLVDGGGVPVGEVPAGQVLEGDRAVVAALGDDHEVFAFEDYPAALERLEAGDQLGKLVLAR